MMKGYVQYFIMASIIYFVLGTFLGMAAFFDPWFYSLRTIHLHLNLLGFMSMMIFGVLYHVLPRFLGKMLYSDSLAWFHFFAGNATFILLMAMMFVQYAGIYPDIVVWTKWIALAQWLTILVFAYNVLRTIMAKPKRG